LSLLESGEIEIMQGVLRLGQLLCWWQMHNGLVFPTLRSADRHLEKKHCCKLERMACNGDALSGGVCEEEGKMAACGGIGRPNTSWR
jgi:hypothetical protein